MYPTLCKVTYWDEINSQMVTKCALIYADTYVSAAEQIENYYGTDCIESLSIQMYDVGIWEVSEDEAARLIERM